MCGVILMKTATWHMPLNNLMTKIFKTSSIEELAQGMFAHMKTQVKNPKMPESGSEIDQILQ